MSILSTEIKIEQVFGEILAKAKSDGVFRQALLAAPNANAAAAIAQQAGFNVTGPELIAYNSIQALDLSDQELELMGNGIGMKPYTTCGSPAICSVTCGW